MWRGHCPPHGLGLSIYTNEREARPGAANRRPAAPMNREKTWAWEEEQDWEEREQKSQGKGQ